MGCYGIGINRIMAAAIEAGHDDNGIIWPLSLAPYQVSLIPLQVNKAEVMDLTRKLEQELEAAGVDVLTDDRDQRPGVKFKDVDLIGVPLRVVIGERGLKDGSIEVKWRHEAAARNLPLATAVEAILAELAGAKASARCLLPRADRRPIRGRDLMKAADPLPRLPYVLLAAMTVVSFGGPFVIVGVIWGGDSAGWPPDRPIEWVTIGLVLALFLVLFVACVSIRLWYRPKPR